MCLGIPGRIVKIDDAAKKLATVEVCGVRRQVNIACIVDDEHPVDCLRRRLGADPCRFRHEPHRLRLRRPRP